MRIFGILLIVIALVGLVVDLSESDVIRTFQKNTAGDPKESIRLATRSIFERCQDLRQAICYEDGAGQLLENYRTSDILGAVYDFDTYFSCHAFTHFLGRALYKRTKSVPEAYLQSNFTCHGGIYHGVMEAFLDERKVTIDSLGGSDIQAICSGSKTLTAINPEQIYTECLHGFGHAFMFITNADLPKSLGYCDKLDASLRERCWGGAFMENSTSSTNLDHQSQWIRADDKQYPCNVLAEQYKNQCYFYQANYWIMTKGHNYQSVFADCYELGGKHREHCVLGMGANLASFSNEAGIDKAAGVCTSSMQEMANVCVDGAISSFFVRYGGDSARVVQFCGLVDANLMIHCFGEIGKVARRWLRPDDNLEAVCSGAGTYKDVCLAEGKIS